jgi:hypothetical protein
MSFESDQAVGINRVYNTNEDIRFCWLDIG